jgi:hypothetical protein
LEQFEEENDENQMEKDQEEDQEKILNPIHLFDLTHNDEDDMESERLTPSPTLDDSGKVFILFF